MARYYEETALIEFVKERTPTINGEATMGCVERAIREAPTADVVPKSEVEKLSHKCDECAGCTQWKCDCANIELEVAREIFEEIEKIIDNEYNKHIFGNNDLDDLEHEAIINFSDCVSSDLEELKKKYKVCDGNCQRCDQAIWKTPTSFVGDNRIIGCKWKESEGKK